MSVRVCVCAFTANKLWVWGSFLLRRAVIFPGSRTIWKGIREDKVQGYNIVRTALHTRTVEDTSQKANACRSNKRKKRPRLHPAT